MNEFVKNMFKTAISDLSEAQKEDMAKSTWEELAILKKLDISWSDAKELLSKGSVSTVEEEELVLPYAVSEWLKDKKERGFSLGSTLTNIHTNKFVPSRKEVQEWVSSNSEKFALAWITDNYSIEPEVKFFWRKKKEYLANFEEDIYMRQYVDSGRVCLSAYKVRTYSVREAMKLLGSDFHMFEKVENVSSEPEPEIPLF